MKFDFKNNHFATIVMILSFIYGGISLLFFFMQIGTLERTTISNPNFMLNESNITSPAQNREFIPNESLRRPEFEARTRSFFYMIIIISLLGSVISILSGISILFLLRKHERKVLTKNIVDTMTTPEEKLVIEQLEKSDGELTQSELVKSTHLSKVKIHRVIKRLEEMKVIAKYPYGMTNKIKLETRKE
jgi:uncharacterized membrane protein